MKPLRIFLVLSAIPILNLGVPMWQSPNPTNGWHTVTDNSFTFQLPDEMTEGKTLGDHAGHMRTFGGKRIPYFTLNYRSMTCETLTGENTPNVEHSTVDVHGRKGILTTAPSPNDGHFLAGICFDNIDGEGRRLRFYAVCIDREALNLAKEIFRTVEVHSQ